MTIQKLLSALILGLGLTLAVVLFVTHAASPVHSPMRLGNPVTEPAANAHAAPPTTTVSITYDEAVDPASVSSHTFAVYAMQTGILTQTIGVHSSTIVLTPAHAFKPGELVQVSATTGTLNLSGQGPAIPTVWQFWAAVPGGTGAFTDSGQRLGNAKTQSVALGDLDGDGDLDAFTAGDTFNNIPNKIWLNDGVGNFTDSGQSVSRSYFIALGDLDSDGDLDAFAVNGAWPSRVWLNDGAGVFVDSGQRLDGDYSWGVALGDVDGDGDLDALVVNEFEDNVVWLNDGTGSFSLGPQGAGRMWRGMVGPGGFGWRRRP
jgi:hypothetical protein